MITDFNDLYIIELKNKGKKSYSVECLCEICNKPFIFTKRGTGYRRIFKNKEILCHECAASKAAKSKYNKNIDKLSKAREERFIKYNELCIDKEEKDTQIKVYTMNELLSLKENKSRGCTCVCSNCGTEWEIRGRTELRRYINYYKDREELRCKSCNISINKIKSNKSFKLESLINCEFIDGQEYEGCDYGVQRELRKKYKFKCKVCNNIFENSFSMGDEVPVTCPICNPLLGKVSYAEKELVSYIKDIYKGQIIENCRTIIKPYELDIYLPDKKIAIEFDGRYWHNNSKKSFEKYKLCSSQGIRLIMMYDYEWEQKSNLIKEVIKSQIVGNDIKIGARKCKIKEVNVEDSIKFLNENHLQGSPTNVTNKNTVCIGLYFNDELVQIETFNKPRFNKNYQWELIRECSKLGYSIYGGKSKILKYFKEHFEGTIISYCDKRFFSGESYDKLGFKKLKDSPPSYIYFKNNIVYSREKCMKHNLNKFLLDFDPDKTESENMINNGYFKLWDFGNFVYLL